MSTFTINSHPNTESTAPFSLDQDADKWLPSNKLKPITVAQKIPNNFDTADQYQVVMQAIKHTFHPRLQDIPMWSYGPTSPGYIIEAKVGNPVRISWFNNLQKDDTLHHLLDLGDRQGMEEDHMMNISHNVVHLHGARVPWTSDGFPEHIYHHDESHVFYYPNNQAATTLWYHDHAMNVTRMNVYAGLFGVYLLRDPSEAGVLPAGALEITLILQDKSFSADGSKLRYEQTVDFGSPDSPGQSRTLTATPEFVGTYPVVNGQVWPLLEVQPRIYRFRLVNGANTRFFNLSLTADDASQRIRFFVIGTEGGFLKTPEPTYSLLMAPGERVDLLVDLRRFGNTNLILRNDAPIPYSGDPSEARFKNASDYTALDPTDPCAELLKLCILGPQVAADEQFDPMTITLPQRIDPLPPEAPSVPPQPTRVDFIAIEEAIASVPIDVMEQDLKAGDISFKLRRFKLEEYQLEMSTFPLIRVPTVQINGLSWMTAPPVSTTKNALEVWEFVNVTPDTHPMHIHLVQFQVISRTWLDVVDDPQRASPDLTEPKRAAGYSGTAVVEPFEMGWKDTVRCNPSQSTRLLVRFDGFAGDYVYHCHILEHEDMGMMYKLNVE